MRILIALLITTSAYAAGDGHGGPMDLIAPAVNLSILLAFMVYKLKGPASNYFKSKSEEVSTMVERASVKAKEAEMMLKMQSEKMQGAESEIDTLKKESMSMVTKFEAEYKSEVQDRIKSMKEDAGQKIEAEKKELVDELNSTLLDQVIYKTKSTLKSDKTMTTTATNKTIEGIK